MLKNWREKSSKGRGGSERSRKAPKEPRRSIGCRRGSRKKAEGKRGKEGGGDVKR